MAIWSIDIGPVYKVFMSLLEDRFEHVTKNIANHSE